MSSMEAPQYEKIPLICASCQAVNTQTVVQLEKVHLSQEIICGTCTAANTFTDENVSEIKAHLAKMKRGAFITMIAMFLPGTALAFYLGITQHVLMGFATSLVWSVGCIVTAKELINKNITPITLTAKK